MNEFYAFALSFASAHAFIAGCAVLLTLSLPFKFLNVARFLVWRSYRLLMVSLRGWPPAHLDADGDWKPESEYQDEPGQAT